MIRLLLLLFLAVSVGAAFAQTPVIFDTDMGNDIDDALALAMLHALDTRGEVKLLAVTITKDHPNVAPFIEAVNTFYGRPNLPVGMVRQGVTPQASPYVDQTLALRDAQGRPLFPRRLRSGADAPDAVALLERTLAAAADNSVIIVQVGFATNLARLLDAPGGAELACRKVKLVVAMFGSYPSTPAKPGLREYNVKEDIASSRRWTRDWPGPIVFSGFEVGQAMKYPWTSIERDFRYAKPAHPVAEAYKFYMKPPYDRQTWDLTAVLYAARADRGYFGLSEPGTVSVDETGANFFAPAPGGRHRYLTVTPEQQIRVLEALQLLSSEPPARLP